MLKKNQINFLKNTEKPILFIVGKPFTTGMGIIQCCSDEKIPVAWIDSNKNQFGFLSKYCTGIISPNSKTEPKKFIDFLIQVGKLTKQKGVLFPTGDICTLLLIENKKKLEKYFRIPLSDFEKANILLNKKLFYKELGKLGIAHPKTLYPSSLEDLKRMGKKIPYPCIIKPMYSEHFRDEFNVKLFVANTKEDLFDVYKKIVEKGHKVIVQEKLGGSTRDMYGLNAFYDKDKNCYSMMMYRRIYEWPVEYGNGSVIETVNVPELKEIVDKIVNHLDYYGIVDAEFKIDPKEKIFKILEINPRPWMQISLTRKAGVNIVSTVYKDLLGKNDKEFEIGESGVKWIFTFDMLGAIFDMIMKKNFSLRYLLKAMKGKKQFSLVSRDDMLPWVAYVTAFIFYLIPCLIKLIMEKDKGLYKVEYFKFSL